MKNILYGSTARRRIFQIDAVTFDGTNDYMLRGADLTGSADSSVGMVSFWVKFNADDAIAVILANTDSYFNVYKAASNKITIIGWNSDNVKKLDINSSAIVAADGWTHIMASWNVNTAAKHLYKNNVDDITVTTLLNGSIDYTRADWAIGASAAAANKLNADIAELYFANQYLDLSQAANRAKLYSNSGKPVDPGIDGSLVTGTQPIIYESVRPQDAATVFATNKGSGGNFTITGALAIAATSPSD